MNVIRQLQACKNVSMVCRPVTRTNVTESVGLRKHFILATGLWSSFRRLLDCLSAIQIGLVLPPFMAENDVCRIFWGPTRYWQVRAKQTHQPPARQKLTDSNTMPGWINEGKGYGNSVWLSVLGYSLFSSWFLNPASISNHNWFQNQTDVSSNHFHV